jgi:hypothetical protein
MNQQSQPKPSPYDLMVLIEIRRLCGPPPVLSSENVKAYDTMLLRLIESLQPHDFFEGLLIKHIADYTWEIIRYNRHEILLMERGHRRHLDSRAQRIKAAAQNKRAQAGSEPPADAMHAALKEIEAMMLQPPTEADHAEALEGGIDYAERLDEMRNTATVRRDRSLQQLEQKKEVFGFVTITNYQPGVSERAMRAEFDAIAAAEQRLQAAAPPAPSSSEGKQVEPPPPAT